MKLLSRLPAIALLGFAAVIGALSCDPAPSSGASDSGASADARASSDAGSSARDSGTSADAGAPFDAGSPADSGTSADSGSTHGGGEPVVITGKVSKLAATGQVTPLSGATVEVVGVNPANSTTTASDGTYSLTVEPGSYFVRASKQDMVSMQAGVITSQSTAVTEMSLLEVLTENLAAGQVGIKVDLSKGIAVVGFDTTDTGGGYKATLSAPAEASFALSEKNRPSKTEITLAGGQNALFFINVMPGTTSVTFTAPSGRSCTETLPMGTYRIDANVGTAIGATCK